MRPPTGERFRHLRALDAPGVALLADVGEELIMKGTATPSGVESEGVIEVEAEGTDDRFCERVERLRAADLDVAIDFRRTPQ
jgi:hypothetical protein